MEGKYKHLYCPFLKKHGLSLYINIGILAVHHHYSNFKVQKKGCSKGSDREIISNLRSHGSYILVGEYGNKQYNVGSEIRGSKKNSAELEGVELIEILF